jgi:hypothetical protein
MNDYTGNVYSGFANSYVSQILFLIIALIIGLLLAITFLLVYKKKPIKVYAAGIIFFIILIIFLSAIKNVMITLETSVITAETARIFRDLSLLSIFPQIFFIIVYLLRTFGLAINKFNFEKDIKDLEVEASDDEEVELTFAGDATKIKRNIRRFGREFKYYILENKFIMTIIFVILVVLALYLIYKSFPTIVDKNYEQKDTFFYNNLYISVEDSIVTNLDFKGDSFKNNVYYVVAKLKIENQTKENKPIDFNNFRLELGKDKIYPSIDKSSNFSDYAGNCTDEKIRASSTQYCALTFEIDSMSIKKNYKIVLQNGTAYVDGSRKAKFNYITITPAVIDSIITEGTHYLDETLDFSGSNINGVTLKISNPTFAKKYTYDYEYCYKENKCTKYKDIVTIDYAKGGLSLIILDYEFDSTNDYIKSINSLITNTMRIKYVIDDVEYYANLKNVTPDNLKGKIVLETTDKVRTSKNVELIIRVRNKEYSIKIK